MHFSNIIEKGELEEKEVSISSKDHFKDNSDFIKKSLKKSNNRGRPQKWYNLDAMILIIDMSNNSGKTPHKNIV